MRFQFYLVLFSALISFSNARSAELSFEDSKDGKTRINLQGEIFPGDAEKLKTIIKGANDRSRMVATVRLNSIGGNLVEGLEIGNVISRGKIATAILSNSTCASACFIIFAAGNEKYSHYTALVGVHGASDSGGNETLASGAATITMARAVKQMGVPPSIIGKMVVTPPSQMVWLTPDDLRTMGVTMLGKPAQVAQPNQPQLPQVTTPDSNSPIPQTKASAPPPTWNTFVDTFVEISKSQNNGRAKTNRVCQPESKTCITGVWIKRDGKDVLAKVEKDLSDRIVSREVCEFNQFNDVRSCFDWDRSVKRTDMKNSDGNWVRISD